MSIFELNDEIAKTMQLGLENTQKVTKIWLLCTIKEDKMLVFCYGLLRVHRVVSILGILWHSFRFT